jgi:hypothetical protein
MKYIALLILGFFLLIVLSLISRRTSKRKLMDTIGTVTAVLFSMFVVSPVFYEFQPLGGTQYEIIRDKSGEVTGLAESDGGFHIPFMSGKKFVTLRDGYHGEHIFSWKFNSGGTNYHRFYLVCKDTKRAFIRSNGEVIFGGPTIGEWFHKTFIDKCFPVNQDYSDLSHDDVQSRFWEYAKEWNEKNEYAIRIQKEGPKHKAGPVRN